MRLIRHDILDSTNEEARRLTDAGERGPVWIVTREQTGGRGRRGRPWVSLEGNLFSTLLITPLGPVDRRAQLSFVACVAVADTVAMYAGPVTLKWPNDVLLTAKKVSGILLESCGDALAIGFGVNLAAYPTGTDYPATSIVEVAGRAPAPDDALAHLAAHWDAWYDGWQKHGFVPVREAWLSRAAGLKQPIRVRLMDKEMHGVFDDIDEAGALVLRQADGSVAGIAAGDVFFGV